MRGRCRFRLWGFFWMMLAWCFVFFFPLFSAGFWGFWGIGDFTLTHPDDVRIAVERHETRV